MRRRGGAEDGPLLGEAQIIADERTNSLLVYGTKRERDKVKEIVEKLDVVQPQVLIEAIIMEVTIDSGFNFGISAAHTDGGANASGFGGVNNLGGSFFSTSTNFPSGLPEAFSYFGRLSPSWDLALEALERDSSVNVLSRPRIQTTHAVEATLRVGRTVPFVTGTVSSFQGGGSSQFQNEFVGIELNVLPLINQDGLVVLEISQDVAELGPTTTIDNNAVPTTLERSAQSSVAVQDGETIMLGGFISNTLNKSETGVPFLKNIPFLGNLFKSQNDTESKVELIVLIRPTVLPNPQDAAIFASREKESLSGVALAELQILKQEAIYAEKNRKAMKSFVENEEKRLKNNKEEDAKDAAKNARKAASEARKALR
ncbi:hypothetical protein N9059_01750 [bacterium]|nr:hypothetical protein [bacterium]